jgi:hypothetical protein
VCSKLRGKLFLRTFLSSSLPLYAFWSARRVDFLPIDVPEQLYFAEKTPFARLRPSNVIMGVLPEREGLNAIDLFENTKILIELEK